MINLRDHLSAEALPTTRSSTGPDFLRAALIRTRFLGPLRQGTTEIGKDILILGGSEIGMSCALNLDLQGFRVRLVHNAGSPMISPAASRAPSSGQIPGRAIVHVQQAVVEEISGHIGDFKVKARMDGKRVRWRADIVCLTDENVLSLAIPEDLAVSKNFTAMISPFSIRRRSGCIG